MAETIKAHGPITPGEIVRGKRSITTDTALRLSKPLGVDDRF